MFQILILEIVGIFSILNICIVWEQKLIHHLIAGILIGIIVGMYYIVRRKRKNKIRVVITRSINEDEYIETLNGLRQIGISLGIIGLMVFPTMLGVGNRVLIRIEEIARLMALMSTLILDILIIETVMIGPLMMCILYKRDRNNSTIKKVDSSLKVIRLRAYLMKFYIRLNRG